MTERPTETCFANRGQSAPQPAKQAPIGIFDSGVGGLTVLSEIEKLLPKESIVYVGDTANAPYGGKSHEELLQHGRDIITFLLGHNVKAVVLACGSTSSTVYEQLVAEFPHIPLIDVIRPGVQACLKLTADNPNIRIGFIATAATVKSGLFAKLLKAQGPALSLLTRGCPMFAPMVEAGVTHGPIAKWATETYVADWRGNIDALVLGCTHYPLLADSLAQVLGADVQFLNFATHTAQALEAQLAWAGSLNDGAHPPEIKFYVSGDPGMFNKTARFLLRRNLDVLKLESM